MTIDSTTKVYLNGVEQVKIIKNGSVIWEKQQDNTDYFYIENTYAGQNTVTLTTTKTGTPTSGTYATSVQWSKDKSTWTTITLTTAQQRTFTLDQGEKVYFRNNSGKWNKYVSSSENMLNKFSASQSHIVGGNANTLLDYTDLNNITLTEGCFHGLFAGDTTITGANLLSLPSMSLSRMCYTNMFRDCSSLTSIPTLPATTLNENCYSNMFLGTAITIPPVLPATTMTRSCYLGMFRDCTSLTTAPVLGSTSLYEYCYQNMFRGCTSLTTAPDLPATTLADYCYSYMFYGCTSLNSVTTYANDISATDCIKNWLYGVANSGTFYNNGSATYTTSSPDGIPTGWTEVKPQPAVDYFYIQNEYNGSNTITITTSKYDAHDDDPETDPLDMTKCGTSLQWSKDKSTWTTLTLSESSPNTITMNQGEKVYFRNDTGKFNYMDDWESFWYSSITNNHSASTGGDIHTLIDYTGTNISTRERNCLWNLFIGNTGLTDASNLTIPSTTPVTHEYESLFMSSGIVTPPSTLPATTLAEYCYGSMFYGCHALTSVPSLPATTLEYGCYSQMFSNCTSLTSVPSNLLPATDLTDCYNCYSKMFKGCSSLTTPPSLPATTLSYGCYEYMFESSGITTAPSLPATTLEDSCYSYMFLYCSSLTTPPSLPATTLASGCYMYMFESSGITTAPVLPAWNLIDYCYQGMLADTDITTAPELPAYTLVEGCYMEMFAGCENLNEVTCYATDITATDCTVEWLVDVAASGTLYAQRGAIYTTDDSSGVPVGWTLVRMDPS